MNPHKEDQRCRKLCTRRQLRAGRIQHQSLIDQATSTVLGNNITVDAEIAKLSLVVRVAREVWG
jgi:hypothetical protein